MENQASIATEKGKVTANVQFYNDVVTGLTAPQKFLHSKYFYDASGDRIFQEIMASTEYYPTDCEMEIFSKQTAGLADAFLAFNDDFDLIELGAGDGTKSAHLLRELMSRGSNFTYTPIDISANIIDYLQATLPVSLPGIKIEGLNGEYFDMLKFAASKSDRRKVVLFLGGNIGNMLPGAAHEFCKELRGYLRLQDMAFVGFDLKKNPHTILAAYNDRAGLTRLFNLNLLTRINRELSADFQVEQFEHYPTYDPQTGSCKSYLVSKVEQNVVIGDHVINFQKNETIYMEVSQKYTSSEIGLLASSAGFKELERFYDSKAWYMDSLWLAV